MPSSNIHRGMRQGVTGRDDYILKKALAYAIVCIRGLPSDRQEIPDRNDMLKLFEHFCDSNPLQQYFFINGARSHIDDEAWSESLDTFCSPSLAAPLSPPAPTNNS